MCRSILERDCLTIFENFLGRILTLGQKITEWIMDPDTDFSHFLTAKITVFR